MGFEQVGEKTTTFNSGQATVCHKRPGKVAVVIGLVDPATAFDSGGLGQRTAERPPAVSKPARRTMSSSLMASVPLSSRKICSRSSHDSWGEGAAFHAKISWCCLFRRKPVAKQQAEPIFNSGYPYPHANKIPYIPYISCY